VIHRSHEGAGFLPRSLPLLLLVLLVGYRAPALAATSDLEVALEVVQGARSVRVQPTVTARRQATLRYVLTSERLPGNGQARTRQAGTFEVRPGETRVLATLTLGTSGDARYRVTLELYEGTTRVARREATLPREVGRSASALGLE